MKTLTSASGKKVVNIRANNGNFIAMYCQIIQDCDGQVREQVLQTKHYKSEKTCIKWGEKQLAA